MNFDTLPLHYFSEDVKKTLNKGLTRGVVFGNFGACNAGDEAILSGELRELKKIPGTKITVMSRYPKRVKKLHGVESVSMMSLISSLFTMYRSDYVILGGGGLYCKIDTGVRGVLFQLYTTILFLYLPLLLQKNVVVTGIGFYKNTNRIIARFAIPALRHVQTVGVRDEASLDFLKQNRVKATLFKDNSFLMPLESKSSDSLKPYHKLYRVGLALNKPQKSRDADTLIREIASFIKNNKNTTHFVFYTLDFHPGYFNDKKFANKIIKFVNDESVSFEFYPASRDPRETFSTFAKMDFMITSRLHGSIMSYRCNVPFYAISYDTKCESFLSKIRHQYVRPEDVSLKDINEYFQSAQKIKNKIHFTSSVAFNGRLNA